MVFNDTKLFDLLIGFGFSKVNHENFIIFKQDDEIFVFPNSALQNYHYLSTRKHLYMNGWISEKEFDLLFT